MNSIIISFILGFIKNFTLYFENSVFNKIQDKTKKVWLFLTQKSFFANWFSSPPKQKSFLENSLLFRIYKKIFNLVSIFLIWFSKKLKQSYITTSFSEWYRNFFTISIKSYCLFILGLTIPYILFQLLTNTITNISNIIIILLLIVATIGCFINKSILSLTSNSIITQMISKIFEINLQSVTTEQKCSTKHQITHLLIGVILSAFCIISKSLIPAIIFIGMIALGTIAFDFRIGVFTTLILMPILPTMGVVALILLSFICFLFKILTTPNMTFVKTPLDTPIIILSIILCISAITSFSMLSSIKIFLVYFAFILGYFLITNTIKSKTQLYTVINAMLFAGAIVALYGIYQYIFGFEEGRIWTDNDMFSSIKTRVVSTFSNPNVLGEYLLFLIPISIGYIFSKKESVSKLSNTTIAGLLCLCMIFTYSRGNWVGLIIGMILFFMFYDGKFVWWGLLAILFVPVFMPDTIMHRLLSIGDVADSSTSYRVNIWYGTCRMLKDYWLSGVGLGTNAFGEIYQHYAYSGVLTQHSHNLYLQLISENGIIGLITFIVIIFTYYKMCISNIIINKKDKVLKSTITALAAGMFGYLIQGLFDNVWYNYRIVFMFFIILAITSCTIIISNKNKDKGEII